MANNQIKTIHIIAQKYLTESNMTATANDVFVRLAAEGNLRTLDELIRETRGFPDQEFEEMIHGNNDEAFFRAAEYGHLKIIKCLIDLTKDDKKKQKDMIHASGSSELMPSYDLDSNTTSLVSPHNNEAFTKVVSKNYIDIAEYLIEQTPEKEMRRKMIRSDQLELAVENNSPEMLLFLLKAMPDDLERLIHPELPFLGSPCFDLALKKGYFEVANLLIDLTEVEAAKEMMVEYIAVKLEEALVNQDLEKAILILDTASNKTREILIGKIGATIDPNTEEFLQLLEIVYDTDLHKENYFKRNEELIEELKGMRGNLISRFGEQDQEAESKANAVIATLLTGNNLEKIENHFAVKNVHGNFPITFPTLSETDQNLALGVLIPFFNTPPSERATQIRETKKVAQNLEQTVFNINKI